MRKILRPLLSSLQPSFSETKLKYRPDGKKQLLATYLLLAIALSITFSAILLSPSLLQADSPTGVDSFDVDQGGLRLVVPEDIGKAAHTSFVNGEILGGERDLRIELTAGIIEDTRLKGDVSASALYLDYGPTVAGSARIEWDGPDGDANSLDPVGLGGVDLTNGGTKDAFLLQVSIDDVPVNPEIEVFTDGNNSSTLVLPLPGLIDSPVDYIIPFNSFTPTLGSGADFTHIGAIAMFISSDTTLDFIIDTFDTTALLNATKTSSLIEDDNGDNQANPGETLRYSITINNPADAFGADAIGVVFSDTLDLNTTLVVSSVTTTQGTVTRGNNQDDSSLAVDIGTIPDGSYVTVIFDVTVNDSLSEDINSVVNQGLISSDTLNNLPTDDPATDTTEDATVFPIVSVPLSPTPDISATKVDLPHSENGETQVRPGDTLTYTVSIVNGSDTDATGVVFSDTLDLNTTLVVSSVTTTQGTVTRGNNQDDSNVAVDIGTMASGEGVEISYEVTVNDTLTEDVTELANQGTILGSNFPDVLTDDPDTEAADDATVTPVALP